MWKVGTTLLYIWSCVEHNCNEYVKFEINNKKSLDTETIFSKYGLLAYMFVVFSKDLKYNTWLRIIIHLCLVTKIR